MTGLFGWATRLAAGSAPIPMSLRLGGLFVKGGMLFVAAGLASIAAWLNPGFATPTAIPKTLVFSALAIGAAKHLGQSVARSMAEYAEARCVQPEECRRDLESDLERAPLLTAVIAALGILLSLGLPGGGFALLVGATAAGFVTSLAIGSGKVADV